MPVKGKPYSMTPEMKDVLLGNLLGDGSLTENKSKKKAAWFTHAQTSEKKVFQQYSYHVYNIMKPITLSKKPAQRPIKTGGIEYTQSVFNTSFYPELYEFFILFYVPNPEYEKLIRQGMTKINRSIRVIPKKQLKEWMNKRVLTYWYLDDGSGNAGENKKETRINTQSFSFLDVVFLCRLLTKKFDLYCWPVPRRKNKKAIKYDYQIYISSHSRNQLIEVTKEFFFEPLRQKLLPVGSFTGFDFSLSEGTVGTGRFQRSISWNCINNTFIVSEKIFSEDMKGLIEEQSFEISNLSSVEYFKEYRDKINIDD